MGADNRYVQKSLRHAPDFLFMFGVSHAGIGGNSYGFHTALHLQQSVSNFIPLQILLQPSHNIETPLYLHFQLRRNLVLQFRSHVNKPHTGAAAFHNGVCRQGCG